MLRGVVSTTEPDFKKILTDTGYAPASLTEIRSEVKQLAKNFEEISFNGNLGAAPDWIMGQLHMKAIGKLRLAEVRKEVSQILEEN